MLRNLQNYHYLTLGLTCLIWLNSPIHMSPYESSACLINHNAFVFRHLCLHNYWINAGIRVQSLKKGQIIMDIDLRWGGDPSIILAVEAALVASIPIQVGELFFPSLFHSFHAWISFSNPSIQHRCNLNLVIVLLSAVEGSPSFHCCSCYLPTCRRDTLYFCCYCCSTFWGTSYEKCSSAWNFFAV